MSQKIVNDALLAESSRALQIVDACEAAGRMEWASKFVADGRTVADAKEALIRLSPMAHVYGVAEDHAPDNYPTSGPVVLT